MNNYILKKVYITGDCHGNLDRLESIDPDSSVIILGDAGLNYYLDGRDRYLKQKVNNYGCTIYCLRGNHEARPEDLDYMVLTNDWYVNGQVYYEPEYTHIRYLIDGETYNIGGLKILAIGGAYSVDKEYRLLKKWQWFENEQLNEKEQHIIFDKYQGQKFDLILTHTCPVKWEPTDLFLNSIDQSKVDKSMELWLDKLEENIKYNYWLFGHYHDDREINDKVRMFFYDIENLFDIIHKNDFIDLANMPLFFGNVEPIIQNEDGYYVVEDYNTGDWKMYDKDDNYLYSADDEQSAWSALNNYIEWSETRMR